MKPQKTGTCSCAGTYVLELGLNRFEGSGEGVRNDERIRRLYLGR